MVTTFVLESCSYLELGPSWYRQCAAVRTYVRLIRLAEHHELVLLSLTIIRATNGTDLRSWIMSPLIIAGSSSSVGERIICLDQLNKKPCHVEWSCIFKDLFRPNLSAIWPALVDTSVVNNPIGAITRNAVIRKLIICNNQQTQPIIVAVHRNE